MSDDTAYSRIGFFKNRPFLPSLAVKISALRVALATLFFSAAEADVLLPPDVAALAAKLKVNDPIIAWCKGAFNPMTTGAYAIAVSSSKTGGRYLVIEPNARVFCKPNDMVSGFRTLSIQKKLQKLIFLNLEKK